MTRGRIRTCRAGQRVARLGVRRTVGVGRRLSSGQWLAVGAVQRRWRASTAPDGVSRHKSLSLGGDGGEDALLREAHAVGAAAVFRGLKARAADLGGGLGQRTRLVLRAVDIYLAPSAVAAGDGGALARSGLVLLVHVRRRLSVGVRGRRARIHLVWRREAVGLLLL